MITFIHRFSKAAEKLENEPYKENLKNIINNNFFKVLIATKDGKLEKVWFFTLFFKKGKDSDWTNDKKTLKTCIVKTLELGSQWKAKEQNQDLFQKVVQKVGFAFSQTLLPSSISMANQSIPTPPDPPETEQTRAVDEADELSMETYLLREAEEERLYLETQNGLKASFDNQDVVGFIESRSASNLDTLPLNEQIEHMEQFSSSISKSLTGLSYEAFSKMEEVKKQASKLLMNVDLEDTLVSRLHGVINQLNNTEPAYELSKDLTSLAEFLKSAQYKDVKNATYCGTYVPILQRFKYFLGHPEEDIVTLISHIRTDRKRWEQVRRAIFYAAQEADPFIVQKKKITWITGSQSASVPMIQQVAKTELAKVPALVPTGQLLKHNIVPLSGEICTGINSQGVNQNALSGMDFVDIKTCLIYANSKKFTFKAEDEFKYIQALLQLNPAKLEENFSRLKIAFLRIKLMNQYPEKWKELENLISHYILSSKDSLPPSLSTQLEELQNLFKTIQPLELTESALSLVTDSFPLIWGSVTLKPKSCFLGLPGEKIVKGIAELGQQIQLVFTDADHVEILINAVGQYGVQVLSFEAAQIIMGRQLEYNRYGIH